MAFIYELGCCNNIHPSSSYSKINIYSQKKTVKYNLTFHKFRQLKKY
jgi:hypothetical protein